LTLFEKKVNKTKLFNLKFDIYQRGVTFEGPDFYSDYSRLQSKTQTENLRSLTEKIAKHLSAVTFDKFRISRLVLHFKLDHNEKIHLLWCSSLRLENDKYLPS